MDVSLIFIEICTQRNMSEGPKVPYVLHFWHFFDFCLLCCWDALLIDFWLVFFGWFWCRKSINNLSQIDQKMYQKSDAILDGFWMALGSILERFWAQVGGQNGAKLVPKFENGGPKTMSKMTSKRWVQDHTNHVRNGGVGPYKSIQSTTPGKVMGP